jgi:hypothetical protein
VKLLLLPLTFILSLVSWRSAGAMTDIDVGSNLKLTKSIEEGAALSAMSFDLSQIIRITRNADGRTIGVTTRSGEILDFRPLSRDAVRRQLSAISELRASATGNSSPLTTSRYRNGDEIMTYRQDYYLPLPVVAGIVDELRMSLPKRLTPLSGQVSAGTLHFQSVGKTQKRALFGPPLYEGDRLMNCQGDFGECTNKARQEYESMDTWCEFLDFGPAGGAQTAICKAINRWDYADDLEDCTGTYMECVRG